MPDNYEIARSDYARGLATVRKRLGLAQHEVGALVGHGAHDVSCWETGRVRIPDGIAEWLARDLSVDIREIYHVDISLAPPAGGRAHGLRYLRETSGRQQRTVARAMKVDIDHYRELEHCAVPIEPIHAKRAAKYLGVPVSVIYDKPGRPGP